jgi:hypothetical protein
MSGRIFFFGSEPEWPPQTGFRSANVRYYESRLARLELSEAERPKIDPQFGTIMNLLPAIQSSTV